VDDVMGKIGELLSDEESVKQLSELAQMIMSGDSHEGGGSTSPPPDLSGLTKLSGLMGAFSQSDPNADLLLALKPHLGEERQKKVDKAVKLLRLLAVWSAARESGLLDDIL
jgi:hypothetical protein